MSIYSDYECGAISDEELRNFGVRMNRQDRYEQIKERMCDEYCYYAIAMHDQDVLDKHCEECPMNELKGGEYEEDRDFDDGSSDG